MKINKQLSMQWVIFFVLSICVLSSPLRAQEHPNDAPGVAVNTAFQTGDVDNINLFNGSLTIKLPLGISYPVAGKLSYQFSLVANSNPWQFGSNPSVIYSTAQPSHCSNAGLGWRVSFGSLNPCLALDGSINQPYGLPVYEGFDGSQHIFYGTLHALRNTSIQQPTCYGQCDSFILR